jgi:isopenicillin-N epimerase
MADLRSRWQLDPTVTFLNHGSFGACPTEVLAFQQRLRERLESEPVRFYVRELEPLLDQALASVGAFVGARSQDLAFVPNATAGVNTVLRSLKFSAGDELLVTDHGYNACRNAIEFVAARAGAKVVVANVPFPLSSPDVVVERIVEAVTPRTRLALIDHITSPTGLVFPIARIVRELQGHGVDVLVDGAHAPGMVPLDLNGLGAAYYTGNCHKWLCAPKGAAILHVREDRQREVRPLTISHGANARRADRSRFRLEFDWPGTFDPTPALTIPECIRFFGALDGGWPAHMEHNRSAALAARDALCRTLGIDRPAPDSMIGSLASVPLPEGETEPLGPLGIEPLQEALWQKHRIEVPTWSWPSPKVRLLRVSLQRYVRPEDIEKLCAALRSELAAG